jgi:hypothetical protein
MKFSLISDFIIDYPNTQIDNVFVKYFIMYYIKNKLNLVDINVEMNMPTQCKFTIKFNFCNSQETITFEMSDINIQYITCEKIDKEIKKISYKTHSELFDYIFNYINLENKLYIQNNINDINKIDSNKQILYKLKENGIHFIRSNMEDNIGQGHLLVNILIYEYDEYLKNKSQYKFSLEINNIFYWVFKFNNINFEFIIVPSVHPLIPPIIDFKTIYRDHNLLMQIITQPYLMKWNSYHSILRLAQNISIIIENYEKINNNEIIVDVFNEANFMLNVFIKNKKFPQFQENTKLYDGIYIEDKISGIDPKINIVVNMTYNEKLQSQKYKQQIEQCNLINIMYYNRLIDLNIDLIDKVVLEMIYNISNINNILKEKIKNYINI